MKTFRNILVSHLDPERNSIICRYLEKYSGLSFETEYVKTPSSGKFIKSRFIFLHISHIIRLFIKRKRFGVIISWSHDRWGLYYACLCRLFRVKKTSTLVLMTFIHSCSVRGALTC